jgi:hypothetical protein
MHATGDTHSVELGQQIAHDPGADNITGIAWRRFLRR